MLCLGRQVLSNDEGAFCEIRRIFQIWKQNLEGEMSKTAIVSGGAQGIGFVITKSLLNEGYGVAVIDCDAEALAWAADSLGGNLCLSTFLCDISDADALERTIGAITKQFSSIDVLVNNAAIMERKPLTDISLDEWNRVIAVNLTAPFLAAKLCAPQLRKSKGCIVNIASTRALMSEPDTESYSASKGGIVSLTHALAASLGPDVRVNAISPGWIEVSHIRKPSAQKNAVLTEADHLQHPAGRVGRAEDVAEMLLFLCSEKSGFITGQNIVLDGGMTKKMIYEPIAFAIGSLDNSSKLEN